MMPQFSVLRAFLLSFFTGGLLVFSQSAGGGELNPDLACQAVRSAFESRDYALAVEILELPVFRDSGRADEFRYLLGLAQFHGRMLDACLETCAELEPRSDDSPWYGFAQLLRARAYVQSGAREKAETIYAAEFERYRSAADAGDDATALMSFAARLAEPPPLDGFTAPPPDFEKMHSLYSGILRMPVSRDQKDEVMYRMALASRRAGHIRQCLEEFRAYLTEFDTGSRTTAQEGDSPSAEETKADWSSGQYVIPAQFHLAGALYSAGKVSEAQTGLRKLLTVIGDSNADGQYRHLLSSSRWLLVQTYRMPNPEADDLEQAVVAARTFAQTHRSESRSVLAAWWIAQAYQNQGHLPEAMTAYRDFIDQTHHGPRLRGMAGVAQRKTNRASDRLQRKWSIQAHYNLGTLHYRQRSFAHAKKAWLDCINGAPEGPLAGACRRRIRDADFYRILDAVAATDEAQARSLSASFLTDYPSDHRRRDVLFLLGQMAYQVAVDQARKPAASDAPAQSDHTTDAVQAAFQRSISEWQRVSRDFPDSRQAAVALYRIGLIQEVWLKEPGNALESYRRSAAIAGDTRARRRAELLTAASIALQAQSSFRTDQRPSVRLRTRNVQSVSLKTYHVDPEVFRNAAPDFSGIRGSENALISPDGTRDITVLNSGKYQLVEQDLEVPLADDFAGVSLVTVSSGDRAARTLVIRSDLDVIVRAAGTSAVVFVFDVRTGQPVKGAAVHVSDGHETLFSGVTAEDGTCQQRFEDDRAHQRLRVWAIRGRHVAATSFQLTGHRPARGRIDSDRSLYQPGQMVGLRGIIDPAAYGGLSDPGGMPCLVSVKDPSGHLIWDTEEELSEYGTFAAKLRLDRRLPFGRYGIEVHTKGHPQPVASGSFTVRHCPQETIHLALQAGRIVYRPGEVVELAVHAAHDWGQPLANVLLHCRLPDGRRVSGRTNASGRLKFNYDTAGHVDPSALLFTVWIEGETLQRTLTVFSATGILQTEQGPGQLMKAPRRNTEHAVQVQFSAEGLSASVRPDHLSAVSGMPVNLSVMSRTQDGQPAGKQIRIRVLEWQPAGRNPVLRAIPWLPRVASQRTVLERSVTPDPQTGVGAVQLTIPNAGSYVLRLSGENRSGKQVSCECRLDVSDPVEPAPLAFPGEVEVQPDDRTARLQLQSKLPAGLALVTLDTGDAIAWRVLKVNQGINPIDLKATLQGLSDCRVTVTLLQNDGVQIAENRLAVERGLTLTVSPEQRLYAPGSEMQVDVQVTDHSGDPVAGEVSLAVVRADRDVLSDGKLTWSADSDSAKVRDGSDDAWLRLMLPGSQKEWRGAAGVADDAQSALADEMHELPRGSDTQLFFPRPDVPERAVQIPQESFGASAAETSDDGQPDLPRSSDVTGSAAKEKTTDPVRPHRVETGLRWDAGLWVPKLLTDAQGKATAKLTLPSAMGEWQITARGVDHRNDRGFSSATVRTGQDFFVTLAVPDRLQQGDSIRPLCRVFNLTEYEGEVNLTLQLTDGRARGAGAGEQSTTVKITKQGVADVLFEPIELHGTGDVEFRLTATAGSTLVDELLKSLSVAPWGLPYYDRQSGVAAGQTTVGVTLPQNSRAGSSQLQIRFSSPVTQSLVELALGSQMSTDTTSDSLSQTTIVHRLYPGSDLLAAVAALRLIRHEKTLLPDDVRITNRIQNLISVLVKSQRQDGSWSRSSGGHRSCCEMTATVLWGLCAARDAGCNVPIDTISSAQTFLETCLHGRVMHRDTTAMVLHALSVNDALEPGAVDSLSAGADTLSPAALGYLALTFAGMDRQSDAADLLQSLSEHLSTVLDGRIQPHSVRGSWFDSETHHNADDLATAALALVRTSEDSGRLQQFRNPLLQRVVTRPVSLGPARGVAVMALMEIHEQFTQTAVQGKGSIFINGQRLQNVLLTTESPVLSLMVPSSQLVHGENVVKFQCDGPAEYMYSATLSAVTPVPVGRQPRNIPSVAARRYSRLPVEYRGRSIRTPRTANVTAIAKGEQVEVHVSFAHHLFRRCYDTDLILEEHLPAGMTVVNDSLSGIGCDHAIEGNTLFVYYPAGHPIRDFKYRLLAARTGRYRVLPAVIRQTSDGTRVSMGPAGVLSVVLPSGDPGRDHTLSDRERWRLAQLHLNDGNYETAFQLASKLTGIVAVDHLIRQESLRNKGFQQASMKLGQMHAEANQPVQAAQFFDRLLPGSDGAAKARMQSGQGFWNAFRAAQPTEAAQGTSEEELDFWLKEAKTRLQEAIRVMEDDPEFELLTPEFNELLLTLAEVEVADEDYEEAISLLTGAAELDQSELGTGIIEMLKSARAGEIEISEDDIQSLSDSDLGKDLGKAYQLLLRARIGTKNLQGALEAIQSLEAMVPDADKQAAAGFRVQFSKAISNEFAELSERDQPERLEEVRDTMESFLSDMKAREGELDSQKLAWAAGIYDGMASGLADDEESARKYTEQADDVFSSILARSSEDGDTTPDSLIRYAESQIGQGKQTDSQNEEVPVVRPVANQRLSERVRWGLVALCLSVIGMTGVYFRLRSVRRVAVASAAAAVPETADVDSGQVRQAYSHLMMRLHLAEKEATSKSDGSATETESDVAVVPRPQTGMSEGRSAEEVAEQATPETAEPGSYIDDYLLTRCISTGRSARVWAVTASDGTPRAMKLLSMEAHQDPKQVAELQREAEIGKSLDHSAFLTVHEFVKTATHTYVITDDFPSITLRKALRKRKSAVHHHASDLIQAISLALFHLHSRGWVHHGLKPDNILVDEKFKIRIVDLSLASRTVCGFRDAVRYALLEWDIATLFGRRPEIRGTRTYIAPETLQRKKPTPQTDMYSFGIMAFEIVTGVPPFTARTPAELLKKHLRAAPPTAASLNPNVSSDMDRILQKLMQKKPQQRYRNMRELITEFARIKVWKRSVQA